MLQSMGSQRVGQDLVTEQQQHRQNWSSVDSTGRSDKPDVRFMLEFHLSYYFPLGIFFFFPEGGETSKISYFLAKHLTLFRHSQLKNNSYVSTIPKADSLNS